MKTACFMVLIGNHILDIIQKHVYLLHCSHQHTKSYVYINVFPCFALHSLHICPQPFQWWRKFNHHHLPKNSHRKAVWYKINFLLVYTTPPYSSSTKIQNKNKRNNGSLLNEPAIVFTLVMGQLLTRLVARQHSREKTNDAVHN